MAKRFIQSYFCLQLWTRDGEELDFESIPGEVCRMIHTKSMKEMVLVSTDTQSLEITRMFEKNRAVPLRSIRYMIEIRFGEKGGRILRTPFKHPFRTPTFLKNGHLYSTKKKLIRKYKLCDLMDDGDQIPPSIIGTQFIS